LLSNVKLIGTDYCTSRSYNYDGFISYYQSVQRRNASCYTQVFHNGIVEAVDVGVLNCPGNDWSYFTQEVVKAFGSYVGVLDMINAGFPVWTALSLLGVSGYKFSLNGEDIFSLACSPIDQEELIIPEAYVEHSGLSGDEVLRPSFDRILNACGVEGMSLFE